jgi:hypothetical protein
MTLANRRSARRNVWPVTVVAIACAVYALSPRVTVGETVLFDWTHPALDRLAFFRASGRFFWPLTYLLLSGAIAVIVSRAKAGVALAVLTAAVVLQLVDLRPAHQERRATSRSEAFHDWPQQLSPAWHQVLPHYRRIVIAPASQCGGAPIEHEELAYLAGLHGLSINSGLGARWNEAARRRYCGSLDLTVGSGRLEGDAIYIVSGSYEQRVRSSQQVPVVCGGLDTTRVCVTLASYEAWRQVVPLSD